MIRLFTLIGLLAGYSTGLCERAIADTSGSGSNYFSCDSGLSNCALVRTDVGPAPGILAKWEVTYDFPCTVGGDKNDSTIDLVLGSNRQRLKYGERQKTVYLEGSSAMRLEDTDRVMTSSWFFDHGVGCGLSLSFRVTPSTEQVNHWEDVATQYSDTLQRNKKIYDYKASVTDWHQKHVQNPEGNDPTIKQIIDALKPLAESDEIIKAYVRSLQDVVDNAPVDQIFGPYAVARQALEEYLPRARQLRDLMIQWLSAVRASFHDAIQAAEASLQH